MTVNLNLSISNSMLCFLSNQDMTSKYKSEQLLWAKTASSGPEQLQMLQLQKQDKRQALHHQEKGYLPELTK